jgi:hypothetical protein
MTKYILVIGGWELNASGHQLTNEEVEKLKNHMSENGIDDLSSMGFDIEGVLNYDIFDANMWVMDKPLWNGTPHFMVFKSDDMENRVLEFEEKEMSDHYEVDENADYGDTFNGFPIEGEEENIILWLEENKGWICDFEFESDEIPTAKDFSMVGGCIETPNGDWDFIDKMYFKGKELQMDFNHQETRGKALTIELWTLENTK